MLRSGSRPPATHAAGREPAEHDGCRWRATLRQALADWQGTVTNCTRPDAVPKAVFSCVLTTSMKPSDHAITLLRLVQFSDGARASARFRVPCGAVQAMPGPFPFRALSGVNAARRSLQT